MLLFVSFSRMIRRTFGTVDDFNFVRRLLLFWLVALLQRGRLSGKSGCVRFIVPRKEFSGYFSVTRFITIRVVATGLAPCFNAIDYQCDSFLHRHIDCHLFLLKVFM